MVALKMAHSGLFLITKQRRCKRNVSLEPMRNSQSWVSPERPTISLLCTDIRNFPNKRLEMRLEEAASRRKEVGGKVGSSCKTEHLLVLQPTHMLQFT